MADSLRELLVSFGIEVDTEELKKGEKEVEGFGDKLKSFVKVVAEAFAIEKVKEFVESQIEAGAQLKVTAERLGTTTDELQALRLAAGEAGVPVEALDNSLRFLNRNIGQANAGSAEQAATFAKLGIALKDASGAVRPAGDVLGDLADHLAETSDAAEKTNIAMKLLGRGGSQLIPLLNRGGEAFEEARRDMQELGGGLSGEFVEAAHKAEEAQVRLRFATTSLSSAVAAELLPGFVKIVHGFTDVVKIGVDVEKRSHIIEDALGFLKAGAIVGGIYKLTQGLRALTTAEGIAAALNPFTLWVVGIALALLAYNDLKVALEGGKSVFGNLFGETGIDQLRTTLDEATTAADILTASLGTVWDILKFIANAASYAGDKFAAFAHGANAAVGRAVRSVTGAEATDQDRAEEGLADAASDRATSRARDIQANRNSASARWDGVTSRTAAREGVAGPDTPEEWNRKHGILPGGGLARPALNFARTYNTPSLPASARGTGGGGGPSRSLTQHVTNHVEVHTSSDSPGAVGKAAGSAVSDASQRANNNALQAFEIP